MPENPVKIMVIDDEADIMEFMQKVLKHRYGFATCGEVDGTRAVELYKAQNPDISILDIQLDKSALDGIDVLREIRKINPLAKCIMITRITEAPAIEQAKKLGAAAYLLKPIDTQEWMDVVLKVINMGKEG